MGSNRDGKLGIGSDDLKGSAIPKCIESLSNITHISCGWEHSAALDSAGQVYSWGCGKSGQLGLGNCTSKNAPEVIPYFKKQKLCLKTLNCGAHFTAFLLENGSAYFCGANTSGQLGLGSKETQLIPAQNTTFLDEISQIACGVTHTLMLSASKQVFSAGGNNFGQLGLGHKHGSMLFQKVVGLNEVYQVAAGHHSAALTPEGQVYLWGTGPFGIYLSPHLISTFSTPVHKISLGSCSGAAVDANNSLWTWGSNTSGELGLGDYNTRPFPTMVPDFKNNNGIVDVICGASSMLILSRISYNNISKKPGEAIKIPGKIQCKNKRSDLTKSPSSIGSTISINIY